MVPAASRIHVGSAAREDRWKSEARDFAVLHLATHGVLDATSPMYSYLALAPSPAVAAAGRPLSGRSVTCALHLRRMTDCCRRGS